MTRELIDLTVTTNTASAEFTCNETGEYFYAAVGTFGSGTLKFYLKPLNQSSFTQLTSMALTASSVELSVWLNSGDIVYVDMDGATSPSVDVTLTWGQ